MSSLTITVPHKNGGERKVDCLDLLATTFSDKPGIAIAAVNKDPERPHTISVPLDMPARLTLLTLNGDSKDAYNDVGHDGVTVTETELGIFEGQLSVTLAAHSVNILRIKDVRKSAHHSRFLRQTPHRI